MGAVHSEGLRTLLLVFVGLMIVNFSHLETAIAFKRTTERGQQSLREFPGPEITWRAYCTETSFIVLSYRPQSSIMVPP